MDDERATITAEFLDNDIHVLSTDPLRGTLELVADDDEIIEVEFTRDSAEALLSALVQFLERGEGRDAPRNITSSPLQ
ncbi:hypothetical protein EHS39_09110 [Ensifer sp. MPMI2T]|nr:hypothetical protein EHS39_09110 [Ensifer sp. MPMI2T]